MSESTCKPWCTNHQDAGANECYTSFEIYNDGKEARAAPVPGSMAAQIQALGGWPAEISRVDFVASQEEEDDSPVMNFHFFEAGGDAEIASDLPLDLEALKKLHGSLGTIIQKFS